ncbi:hypothetical protein LROSL1_0117 [Furfurilactobacillus rossiae]|uniref:hypothetical protein n=1 Tax=Furfurilactobacillus rossiae TaxID=231049 RepID=UPI0015BB2299|nr:hypothetical protein [Furfurilactobacillus rossiae]MCF6165961.1 hypothetical protein [Furfurilactobacillus rossiae]QLE62937.1 hypothetical protein LROSL1_0117 [Furfurilactobacillus rossiae]
MAFLFNWAEVEPDEYAMTTTDGSIVDLGERNYLRIDGEGDESSAEFMRDAAILLALGKFLSTAPTHGIPIATFRKFVHYPLMVNWYGTLHDDHERYQMRMKQPNFMPADAVIAAINQLRESMPMIGDVTYERFKEGLEAQVSQIGLVTPALVEKLQMFIGNSPFVIDHGDDWHRELYLNDVTALPRSQWQIILRQQISVADPVAARNYPIVIN